MLKNRASAIRQHWLKHQLGDSVTVGNFLNLSEPQFAHLSIETLAVCPLEVLVSAMKRVSGTWFPWQKMVVRMRGNLTVL